jgi:hypothetical protein
MKVLLYLVAALAVAAGAAVGTGLMLKPEWRVERSAHIDAPAPPVFAFISVLGNWQDWTAWNKERYPAMESRVIGPQWGVGATLQWTEKSSNGQLEVVDYQQDDYMEYQLSMDDGKFSLRCRLQIEPDGAGSRVTWTAWGDAGRNPLRKLMMRAGAHFIARDFAAGLGRLQTRFKSQPTSAGTAPATPDAPETLPQESGQDDGQTSQD